VAILAVSIGLALIMLTVNGASESELSTVSGLVGNEIQVRPAGSYGIFKGGEVEELDEVDVDQLANIDHVKSVQKSVQAFYTGTELTSGVVKKGTPGLLWLWGLIQALVVSP